MNNNNSDKMISIIKDCSCDLSRYYLKSEIILHNKRSDCWITYLNVVYNLTNLCEEWKNSCEIKRIIANAGKDISHWFDHQPNDIKYIINSLDGSSVRYCPHGPIPDVHFGQNNNNNNNIEKSKQIIRQPFDRCPWWLDDKYKIGYLTKNSRPCKIINLLTGTSAIISVCEEDSIKRIQERFLIFNAHGSSYEWKFENKKIDINKTLTENGILDERDRYLACGLPDDIYIPCLTCYYNDDLTEA